MKTRLAALAAFAAFSATAAPQVWRVDPERSRIHWEVEHFGTSTQRGRFDRFDAAVRLDPEAKSGSVSVTVDTASVSSGVPVLDRVLRGPLMLASGEFPQAWYVAERIEFDAAGRPTRLVGELTLRGVARPFELRAERIDCSADACAARYAGELRRSDHGITHALPFAADRVRLVVLLATRRD